MTKEYFNYILSDLRLLTLFPKRYPAPRGKDESFWRGVARRYGNCEGRLVSSDYRWRVVEYRDGHKELTYLRVLQGGIISGKAPAIYRGLLIPRRITLATFAHVEKVRPAF